jgi:hypothetical protein
MDWRDYQHEFSAQDGLQQIIIADVSPKDWQKILSFLQKTEVDLTFSIDGVVSALPVTIEEIFGDRQHRYLLSLRFDDLTLQCDFARADAIVLSYDPAQITDETRATLLFRVMSTFGRRIRKVAILAAMDQETNPIFRYEHGQGLTYIKLAKKLGPYE